MATSSTRSSKARSPTTVWARRTEARSVAQPVALLRQARANTRAARDDVAFMAGLAREIAETRGRELTLAYRNLVLVMPGFKKVRRRGKERVTDEVCIVFVVRAKRELGADDSQALPAWLCTYADHGGSRKVFAVRTDVQPAVAYASVVPHAPGGIWVRNGDWPTEDGSFACVATLTAGGRSQQCVLGAQHVFTPYPDGSLRVTGALDVVPLDERGSESDAPRLAVTLPYGGVLRSDGRPDRPSFDVQLAAVDAAADLRDRVALRKFNSAQPWVESMETLLLLDQEHWLYLLPADNGPRAQGRGPIRLTLAAMPHEPFPIAYEFAGDPEAIERDVFHHELLCFQAKDDDAPLPGDSGSPIVVRWPDDTMTLVAMHIAGNGEGQSWAIPAWQLFDLDYWWQYPAGARITPSDA